ncbi:MAG: DUF5011 domain-containing protein, partial [Psychromonas sp.]|nr:DUF5011 domain-containing protein [Psychromonas sp.]
MKIRYFLVASALSFLSACGGDNTATSADTTSTTINVFDGAAVGCSVTVSGVVASEIGDGAYSATGTFDDGVVIKATGCTDSDTELLLPDMFGVVQTGGGVVSPITTLIVQSILASDPAAISLSSDAIADAVAQIIANLGLTGYNPIDPTTANYVAAAKADTAGTGTEATAMRVAMAISTLLKGAEISVGTTDAGTMVMTIAQAIYESKSELDLTKSTGIEALLATAGTGASTSVSAALTVTATAVAPSVAMIINTTGAITDAINVTTAIVTILNDATDTSITDSTFSTQLTSAADTKAPVIALTGDNPMTIETGSSYSEPGTTVSDNVDTGLTATITGTVDAATVGSYKLSYNVTDTAGNQAVEITRTVNV